MSEISKYDAYTKKLQGICDENELTFRFRRDRYPITLTIRPLTGVEEQISLLENVEDKGYTSPDAAIVFAYKDGALTYKMSETFTISDVLFSKIKNLFKNLHYCWLQYFFRDLLEKGVLTKRTMPDVEEIQQDLPDEYDPIEAFDDEDDPPTEDDAEDHEEFEPEFVQQAADLVRSEGIASVALLQRRMSLGYRKAARLMEELEDRGVVGPHNGSAPRVVLFPGIPQEVEVEK